MFHDVLNSLKSKDTINARKDLQALDIMLELWINGSRKPQAKYTFTREQLKLLCDWVNRIKLPDGCSSNIARCQN